MIQLDLTICPSPIGEVAVYSAGEKIYRVDFNDSDDRTEAWLTRKFAGCFRIGRASGRSSIREMFERYCNRDWSAFDDVDLETGGTAFQRRVWERLQAIPVGETRSYIQVAQEIELPKTFRAVGQANAKNPIPIIIPCHRVVGKNGGLRGYAGGPDGPVRQRRLLEHEKAVG